MIQLFLYNGVAVIQYGLHNLGVRVILAVEVATVLFGIIIGLLVHTSRKSYILLSVPGIAGCLLFVFINTWGKMILSDAYMWLPPLSEDMVVFSIISCLILYLKKMQTER